MKITNLQLGQKEVKTLGTQTFSKHISNLQMETDLDRRNLARLNTFTDKVAVHLNMLGALMKHRISSYVKGCLIVIVKRSGAA
ncbi:unnamed protein product [Linum trigynum]|uniref:Uncharacterized protein n=1 Tax=Linum trigynum TaxID=586398 RepID=A0AAV2DRP3_9ROSI